MAPSGGVVVTPPDRIIPQIRAGLGGVEDGVIVVPMTCLLDRCDHAVTDSQSVLGVGGRYLAVCGHIVVPGSLSAPPGRPCPVCLAGLAPKPAAARVGRPAALRTRRAWPRALSRAFAKVTTRRMAA